MTSVGLMHLPNEFLVFALESWSGPIQGLAQRSVKGTQSEQCHSLWERYWVRKPTLLADMYGCRSPMPEEMSWKTKFHWV